MSHATTAAIATKATTSPSTADTSHKQKQGKARQSKAKPNYPTVQLSVAHTQQIQLRTRLPVIQSTSEADAQLGLRFPQYKCTATTVRSIVQTACGGLWFCALHGMAKATVASLQTPDLPDLPDSPTTRVSYGYLGLHTVPAMSNCAHMSGQMTRPSGFRKPHHQQTKKDTDTSTMSELCDLCPFFWFCDKYMARYFALYLIEMTG